MKKSEAITKVLNVIENQSYKLRQARNTCFDITDNLLEELKYWTDEGADRLELYEFDNGTFYLGQVENSKRNGFGFQYYDDLTMYMGNWENNSRNGEGYLFNRKLCYHGEFLDGEFCGNGTMISNGIFVWAEFRHDNIAYVKKANTSFTYNGKSYDAD